MGQITQFFQPPLYWQQFEDLTQAVVEIVYGTSHADKIGRPGQSQDGVDVHAGRSRAGALGVQCKRMDNLDENNLPLPGGAITRKILIEEIAKAKTFQPQLDVWILATTAKRDARIQETARRIDRQHAKQKLFEVKLWFWDDYVAFLNSHPIPHTQRRMQKAYRQMSFRPMRARTNRTPSYMVQRNSWVPLSGLDRPLLSQRFSTRGNEGPEKEDHGLTCAAARVSPFDQIPCRAAVVRPVVERSP